MRNFATRMKKRVLVLIGMITMFAVVSMAASKKFTLVIDAGHGGHDAGALGAITKEKTINLNVTLAFGRLVEQNCPDVKVIYTRKTDVFVPLHTRADIANRNKADLFISIHTNALPKGRIARGMETYTLGMHRAADNLDVAKRENSVILIEKDYKQRYQGFDPKSSESYIMFELMTDHNMAESVELAKAVQRRTCSIANRPNKGVRQAGFLVLRETSMPSCLIELGFITTSDEERFLASSEGVNLMARGIYQAFLDYKNKHHGNTASYTAPKEPEVTPAPAPVATTPAPAPVVTTSAPVASAPAPATDTTAAVKAVSAPDPAPVASSGSSTAPVFKVQILANPTRVKSKDARLKGRTDVDCYQDGGMYKYTIGASQDYDEICQLRKTLQQQFPECFVVAFVQGQRVNLSEAIQLSKKKKNKRK